MAAAKKKPVKTNGKETIYVDVDDEITSIIDRVKASEQKIVALVLPKRASVLQSVVNMKLLKKAGQASKKNIVLITSETGLLPLAGAAGLHVAKSLQSKPEIPRAPHMTEDESEEAIPTDSDDTEALDKSASVGSLAAAAGQDKDDDTETIELDNIETADAAAPAAAKKLKKERHLKVPNFERFRLSFALAGLAVVLLIIGWIVAATVLPKATVTIKTNTTSVVSSFDFTASTSLKELDVDNQKIPAELKETKKTDSEKAAATGEKNNGKKAEGTVKLKATACAPNLGTPQSVPAGSTVVSNGKSFITQETLAFGFVNFADGSCANYETDSGDILASGQGESFNLGSGAAFTVSNRAGVTGTGTASGGTDEIVKIVTQKDIDTAVTKMRERQDASAKDELRSLLEADGLYVLSETLKSSDPSVKATPKVDEESDEVTVTLEITYSMLGIKRDDLVAVITKDVEGDIDPEQQSITDDGIDAAVMNINNNTKPGEAFLSFRTSVTAGPELNEDAIKDAIRGKKRGDAEKYINELTGVNEVEIEYSPFWVYSTPKAAKKITIVVEKVE